MNTTIPAGVLQYCEECFMPIADVLRHSRCEACDMAQRLTHEGLHFNQEEAAKKAAKRYERIGYRCTVSANVKTFPNGATEWRGGYILTGTK